MPEVRGLRVLIVDDDESFCRILREFLDGLGCRPEYATSVAEARKVLNRMTYDVVLLDYRFPEGDGLELLDSLRAEDGRTRGIPVVVISGRADPRAEANFLASGGLAWIRKPFSSGRLLEELRVVANARDRLEQAT